MRVRTLESVVRRSGLALRIVDAATWKQVSDGLDVTVWPSASPALRSVAILSPVSAVYGFRALPGIGSYEDGSTPRSAWFASPVLNLPEPFTVRIADPWARYLTVVRSVLVPSPHLVEVPLPRGPASPAPPGHGLLVGQLVDGDTGLPAAWALVEATLGGAVSGGVGDARGMFAVPVPLAAPPSGTGTPAQGPTWDVTVRVRYRRGDQHRAAGTAPSDPPTFESIGAQSVAMVVDGISAVPALVRPLTRSGPLVVASSAPPAPSTLRVQPQ